MYVVRDKGVTKVYGRKVGYRCIFTKMGTHNGETRVRNESLVPTNME